MLLPLQPHLFFKLGIAAILVTSLTGCSTISSLQFDDRLLVKVPGDSIIQKEVKDGWEFRHVAEGAVEPGEPVGEWYLAWKQDAENREGLPHLSFPWSRWVYARHNAVGLMDAAHSAFGDYPTMIEPDFVFTREDAKADVTKSQAASEDAVDPESVTSLRYGKPPMDVWPNPVDKKTGALLVAWHLGDDYTQLTSAASAVQKHHGDGQISIGILDDGFSAVQAGVPLESQMRDSKEGDAMGMLVTGGKVSPIAPGETGATHGTGTIGILAGRMVHLPKGKFDGHMYEGFDGYLGGAPRARIVPVRIAPWVFSVTTANLAYGIDYASRHCHCDVLSLSHGGSPCELWADVVNAAYERGTAMFAAEGDFYSILGVPIQPRGIVVPSAPVYPAAFRRVMGVTGVTSDGSSYATNRYDRLAADPASILAWMSRGSYGPDGSWRTALGMNETPDGPEVKKQGSLRAYPIAAYSPNIPWLVAPSADDPSKDRVDLDGAGTSAATPQVAAAAALWLDYHRAEFGAKWQTWEKAEAVYTALLLSARRSQDKSWPDRYLGAGTLKAKAALDIDLSQVEELSNHPIYNPDGTLRLKFAKAPRDFFDGDRSFGSMLGLADYDTNYNTEADLDQRRMPNSSREKALARIYYNTLLLQQWHAGHVPRGIEITPYLHVNGTINMEADQLAGHFIQNAQNNGSRKEALR